VWASQDSKMPADVTQHAAQLKMSCDAIFHLSQMKDNSDLCDIVSEHTRYRRKASLACDHHVASLSPPREAWHARERTPASRALHKLPMYLILCRHANIFPFCRRIFNPCVGYSFTLRHHKRLHTPTSTSTSTATSQDSTDFVVASTCRVHVCYQVCVLEFFPQFCQDIPSTSSLQLIPRSWVRRLIIQ